MRPINSRSVLSFCLFLVCGMSIVFPVRADKLSTQYDYIVSARQGAIAETSVSQHDNRFKLVEDFSDFQPTGKLMLPHTYTIDLTVDLSNRTQTLQWTINLQQFSFNETIDPAVFKSN